MMRGSTPALAQPRMRARGVSPRATAALRLARTTAAPPSVMPEDDPRRDDAGLSLDIAEDGRKLPQALDRRIGPRVLVALHHGRPALGVGDRDRRDLAGESTLRGCASRTPLTLERIRIGLLARDAVLTRQHLGGLAHDQSGQRTVESVAVHRVHEREVAHPWPHRASSESSRYGMRLIDSMPPASTNVDSPSWIC